MCKSIQVFILFIVVSLYNTVSFAQHIKDSSIVLIDKKTFFETPAAYELMQIAFALTDTNNYSNNTNLYYLVIDTSSSYYKEVINYFSAYKNHQLIIDLNKHFRKSQSRYIYNLLKAYNTSVVENEVARNKRFPFFHGLMYSFNSVSRKEIERFAKASNFQAFYDSHKLYYQAVLEDSKIKLNVSKIQQWLETEFSSKYDQFNIIISPLMHSTHFTRNFKFKRNKTSTMWVSDASYYNTRFYTNTQIAGIFTGTVFTEIDHNYVNPVSDQYKKEVNQIMGGSNRAKWIKSNGDGKFYGSGYKVFNEYMTHAVYLLYTNLNYTSTDQVMIEKSRINLMVARRKYYRFADFYKQLKILYTSKKEGETITTLYPQMLEWCKQQNLK